MPNFGPSVYICARPSECWCPFWERCSRCLVSSQGLSLCCRWFPGEEDCSGILWRPATVHVVGAGFVRLHHGRHSEPVLSHQEEAEGRCQARVSSLRQSYCLESNRRAPHIKTFFSPILHNILLRLLDAGESCKIGKSMSMTFARNWLSTWEILTWIVFPTF